MNIPVLKVVFPVVVALMITGCGTSSDTAKSDTHNSRNSLDWAGVYASDSALLTIASDHTYVLEERVSPDSLSKTQGIFSWSDDGGSITTDKKKSYKVGENQLTPLGNTPQELRKFRKEVASLTDVYWRLSEIDGKPLSDFDTNSGMEAHLRFEDTRKMISGSSGCNRIFGPYELENTERIKFKHLGGTRMMCPSMELETAFIKTLERVTGYEVTDRRLFLKDENRKVLLGFERGLSKE